jgi:hypothetical protein
VAFAIYYGRWPDGQLDHINGDRRDNRIANLREVSNAENSRNAGRRRDNTSGVVGVSSTSSRLNPWRAYIKIGDRVRHLGRFPSIKTAADARRAAERQHGYHENHGTRAGIPKR